jgi:hypothetical protein
VEETLNGSVESGPIAVAHRSATEASLAEIAYTLQDVLSSKLTAYVAGVKSTRTVARWASGEITEIRDVATEQRLRAAYEITQLMLRYDGPGTVRSWFIGMSPELDDRSPAEVIRAGQLKEAMGAARAFIAYG